MFGRPIVRIINNWLHDVGTGLWAACLLVVVVLDAEATELTTQGAALQAAVDAIESVNWLVFWLLVVALVAIAVTGALRLIYWRAETPPEELAAKRPALIGKHIAFLLVYGFGTAVAWWLVSGGAS